MSGTNHHGFETCGADPVLHGAGVLDLRLTATATEMVTSVTLRQRVKSIIIASIMTLSVCSADYRHLFQPRQALFFFSKKLLVLEYLSLIKICGMAAEIRTTQELHKHDAMRMNIDQLIDPNCLVAG